MSINSGTESKGCHYYNRLAKLSGEQILKVMEGQDNLEMKALARHIMQRKRQNMSMSTSIMTMKTMSIIIMTMTTKNMSIIMTMTTKNMSIIMTMSMMKTVPVAAMTMSTITIIMQMMYLPAGARRHRTNSSVQNLRKYLRSLSILTNILRSKGRWRVPMVPGCTLIWFRASMRSVRVSRITPDVSW